MNYKYFIIGFLALSLGALVPFQIYRIRQRRLAEQALVHNHSVQEEHNCCSCH